MELRHLRYFVMVAEERHFTRAAARLNMQQPPLSQQIRALEDELGFALFVRHPKGIELTAGGAAFLSQARDILQRVEDGARVAARVAEGIEGTLALGFTSSAATHPVIPRIVRAYRERFPQVVITLAEGNARELSEQVANAEIDLGIIRAPVGGAPSLRYHRLLNEALLLVLPVGHRLLREAPEGATPAIPLAALTDEPLILVRRPGAPGMYANLLNACENAGFKPRVACEVERMLTNLNLVAAGMGISVVPASMRGLHADSVVYCSIADAKPRLMAPITLVQREHANAPPMQNFVMLARQLGILHRRGEAPRPWAPTSTRPRPTQPTEEAANELVRQAIQQVRTGTEPADS